MAGSEKEFRKLQLAATKALKTVEKCAEMEPSTVIICGSKTEQPEKIVGEIISWLFQRGEGNVDERS